MGGTGCSRLRVSQCLKKLACGYSFTKRKVKTGKVFALKVQTRIYEWTRSSIRIFISQYTNFFFWVHSFKPPPTPPSHSHRCSLYYYTQIHNILIHIPHPNPTQPLSSSPPPQQANTSRQPPNPPVTPRALVPSSPYPP